MIATKPSNQVKIKREEATQYENNNNSNVILPQSDDLFAGLNLPSAPNHPIVVNRSIPSISTTNNPLLVSPLSSQSSEETGSQTQLPITQPELVLTDESYDVSVSFDQLDDVQNTTSTIPNSNLISISDTDITESSSSLSSNTNTSIVDPFASAPIISSTLLYIGLLPDPISNSSSSSSSSSSSPSVVLSADLSKLYVTSENHQRSQMVYPVLPTLYASSSQPLTTYQPTMNDINTANVEPLSRTQQSVPSIHVTNTTDHQQNTGEISAVEALHSLTGIPDTALVNDLISENTKLSQELENLRQAFKIQQEQGVTYTYSPRRFPAVANTTNNRNNNHQNQQQTPIIGHVVNYPLPTNNTIVVNNSMNRNNNFNTMAAATNYHQTHPIRIHGNINSNTISNTSNTSHSFVIPLAVTSSSSSSSCNINNSSTSSGSRYNQNTPYGSSINNNSNNNSNNNTMNGQYAALPSVEDCYDTVDSRTNSNNNSTGYHPTVMMSDMSESDRISLINNTNFYTNNSSSIHTNNYTQQQPSQFSQMSRTSSTSNPATTSNMITADVDTGTRTAVNTSAIKYVCCGTCHQWLTAPLTSIYVYCPSCESINQCNQVPLRPANAPVYLQGNNTDATNQNVPWLLVPLYDCMRGMFT